MDKFFASFKAIKNQCLLVIFITLVIIFLMFMVNIGIPLIQAVIKSLTSLWWAIGFAFTLNIPLRLFEKQIDKRAKKLPKFIVKHKRGLSILVTCFIVFAFIGILFSIIIPQISNSIIVIVNNFASMIAYFIGNINEVLEVLNLRTFDVQRDTQALLNWINNNFNLNLQTLVNQLSNFAVSSSQSILKTVSNTVGEFFNVLMGFLFSIYLLVDKEKFIRSLKKLLALSFSKEKAILLDCLFRDANSIFTDYITGQVTEAIIFGTLCYIGMTILGYPMAMLISVVAAILCLVPIFGPTLGMVFGALIILTSRPILTTLGFMVYYQILQQIENNLIYPRVVGVKVGLPALWVLLCIIVFGSFAGILGMLIAVPITAIFYTFSSTFINFYLMSRNIEVTERTITYHD